MLCLMSEQTLARQGLPQWDLADRLRKSLRHAGIGVQEMADHLDVTRQTIGNWVNGHTRPRPSDLKLWAMRCGLPYEWLAHGADQARGGDGAGAAGIHGLPFVTVLDHLGYGYWPDQPVIGPRSRKPPVSRFDLHTFGPDARAALRGELASHPSVNDRVASGE